MGDHGGRLIRREPAQTDLRHELGGDENGPAAGSSRGHRPHPGPEVQADQRRPQAALAEQHDRGSQRRRLGWRQRPGTEQRTYRGGFARAGEQADRRGSGAEHRRPRGEGRAELTPGPPSQRC